MSNMAALMQDPYICSSSVEQCAYFFFCSTVLIAGCSNPYLKQVMPHGALLGGGGPQQHSIRQLGDRGVGRLEGFRSSCSEVKSAETKGRELITRRGLVAIGRRRVMRSGMVSICANMHVSLLRLGKLHMQPGQAMMSEASWVWH